MTAAVMCYYNASLTKFTEKLCSTKNAFDVVYLKIFCATKGHLTGVVYLRVVC